jgi:hypothetical protein
MRRAAPLIASLVLLLVTAGCTTTGSIDESPSASAAASPIGAAPSIPARPTSDPQPTPTLTVEPSTAPPSFAPGADLASLLPDYAGTGPLEKRPMTMSELTANDDPLAIGRLMSELDLDENALEVATAHSSDIALVAFRAEGFTGSELADAYVKAVMETFPGASLTEVEVDPLVLSRVLFEVEGMTGSLTLLPLGDAMIVASAQSDDESLVERTLARILDPGPETLLPAELDGRQLRIVAMPGESFPVGGDVCSIVCPGEVQAMARALGVEVSDMRLAIGLLEDAPQLAIIAFEAPGVADEKLLAVRDQLGRHDPVAESMTIDGKDVRRYVDTVAGTSTSEQWEYAADGVLYVVYVESGGDGARQLVEETLAALP